METMQLKDLLDLLEKLEARVNSYWNFYSVAVFAVAGWLVTKDKALAQGAAIFVGIGMAVFLLANLAVILHAERRIAAVESEIRALAEVPGAASSPAFSGHLKTIGIPGRSTSTMFLHLTIDAALLVLLYLKRA